MGQGDITFDLAKGQAAGRLFRSEADKLRRLASRMKRATDGTSSWWAGDSINGFSRRADELSSLMSKVVDIVADMGEDILAASQFKREMEQQRERELIDAISVSSSAAAGNGGSSAP